MDNLSVRSRMQYIYPTGQNNGRISESIDGISGENVLYTYDSLQRLILAQTSNNGPQWGDAYSYDGFGNLTAKTPTKGYAPPLAAAYDPATNWAIGGNYDANERRTTGTTTGTTTNDGNDGNDERRERRGQTGRFLV